MSIGDDWVGAFAAADAAAVEKLLARDVRCDINVPEWRFWMSGAESVAAFLAAEEFHEGYRIAHSVIRPADEGAAVELEAHFRRGGEKCLAREVHLLRSGPGGISELTVYCTGVWDAATIQRHAAEVVEPA